MLSTSGMHDAVWLETSLFVLDDFQSYYVDRGIKKNTGKMKVRENIPDGLFEALVFWRTFFSPF